MSSIEQTLSIIKPDAVERNLTENIKKFFLENKLKIVKEKKIQVSISNFQLDYLNYLLTKVLFYL